MSSGYNPWTDGSNWSSGGANNWANTGGNAGYSGWPQQNTTYGVGQQGWDTGYQQPSPYQSQAFGSAIGYRNQMAPTYAYSGGQQYYDPYQQQGQQQFAQYAPPTYQGTDWSKYEQWQGDPSFGGYQNSNQNVSDDQYYQGIGESIPTLQQDEMGRYYTGDDWATRAQGSQDDKRAQMLGFLYSNLGREKPGGGVYSQDDIDRVTGAQAWDAGRTLGEGEDYDWYSGEHGSGYGRNFDVRNPGRALRESSSVYGLADDAPGWRTNQNLVTALASQGLLGEQQDWFGGGDRASYRTEYDQLRSGGIQNLMNLYGYDYDSDAGRYGLRPEDIASDPYVNQDSAVQDLGVTEDPYVNQDSAVQNLGITEDPVGPKKMGPKRAAKLARQAAAAGAADPMAGITDLNNDGLVDTKDFILHGQKQLGTGAAAGTGAASGYASAAAAAQKLAPEVIPGYSEYADLHPGIQDYNNSGTINNDDFILHGQQQQANKGSGSPDPFAGIPDYNNSGTVNVEDFILHGQQQQGTGQKTMGPRQAARAARRAAREAGGAADPYGDLTDLNNDGLVDTKDFILQGQQELGTGAPEMNDISRDPIQITNDKNAFGGIADLNNSGSVNVADFILQGQQHLANKGSGSPDPFAGIPDYNNSGTVNVEDYILHGQQQQGMAYGGLIDGYANGGIASLARGGRVGKGGKRARRQRRRNARRAAQRQQQSGIRQTGAVNASDFIRQGQTALANRQRQIDRSEAESRYAASRPDLGLPRYPMPTGPLRPGGFEYGETVQPPVNVSDFIRQGQRVLSPPPPGPGGIPGPYGPSPFPRPGPHDYGPYGDPSFGGGQPTQGQGGPWTATPGEYTVPGSPYTPQGQWQPPKMAGEWDQQPPKPGWGTPVTPGMEFPTTTGTYGQPPKPIQQQPKPGWGTPIYGPPIEPTTTGTYGQPPPQKMAGEWDQQPMQQKPMQQQPMQQQNTPNPFVGNPLGMNRGGLVGGAIPPISMGRFNTKMSTPVQNGLPEYARAFYQRLTGGL